MTTAVAAGTVASSREGLGGRLLRLVLLAAWLGIAGWGLVQGLDYYRLPLAERAYSPLRAAYQPAGTIGHAFGVAGTLMMLVGVGMYSVRKRVAGLAKIGKLKHWLQVHIFLCTLGPFLVLLHTSFRFGGIVSIAFWSMTIVVASGVFGRYVYTRIPKTLNGRFLSLKTINDEKTALVEAFGERSGLGPRELAALLPARTPPRRPGLIGAMVLAVRFDVTRRRQVTAVRRALSRRGVPAKDRDALVEILNEQIRLEQETVLLTPFQRLFSYWHILHLPLALLMLVIVAVHVAVAVLFGYGWH